MDLKINNFRNFKFEVYKEDGKEYMKLTAEGNMSYGKHENVEFEILKVDLNSLNFNRKYEIGCSCALDLILEFKCFPKEGAFINFTNLDFKKL